jgi:uncharacterized membrane protein YcjF (UPF0283 family)
MANTLQKSKSKRKKTCAVCMRIRYFLIVAGMLLLALWARPDWRLPPGYDYSAIVGDLFLGAFVVVFLWKYWVYRRSRNQKEAGDTAADASREARFEALRRAADAAEAELAQRESQAQKPAEPRV